MMLKGSLFTMWKLQVRFPAFAPPNRKLMLKTILCMSAVEPLVNSRRVLYFELVRTWRRNFLACRRDINITPEPVPGTASTGHPLIAPTIRCLGEIINLMRGPYGLGVNLARRQCIDMELKQSARKWETYSKNAAVRNEEKVTMELNREIQLKLSTYCQCLYHIGSPIKLTAGK